MGPVGFEASVRIPFLGFFISEVMVGLRHNLFLSDVILLD
jgi:hypothetical protein